MSSTIEYSSGDLTLATVQAALQQALSEWRQPAVYSPFEPLRLFRRALRLAHGNVQAATNQVVLQVLAQLATNYPEHAEVIQSRFLDNEKVEFAANRLNISTATFHRKRHEGLFYLAQTLLQMELTERQAYQTRQQERLEPNSHAALFGVTDQLQVLEEVLLAPEAPWLIVITGMGGIGKTTLADALVRRMIEHAAFDEIGWVTARQAVFNAGGSITPIPYPTLTTAALVEALTGQLVGKAPPAPRTSEEAATALIQQIKATPHLLVIDNIETVLDLATLLPTLRRLVNPTKVILTTRDSLLQEADLYHTVVPPLSHSDALALVRQEAKVRNIREVLAASDGDLQPISATVGGNPLALRLVTGQLRVHSLDVVLGELTAALSKQAEALYTFIYQRAWELLDEKARAVLLAMPLISEQGGRFSLIAATCELTEVELREALDRLVMLSLVDVRGNLHERRYTIHNLTRTFLHEQVIRWQQASIEGATVQIG